MKLSRKQRKQRRLLRLVRQMEAKLQTPKVRKDPRGWVPWKWYVESKQLNEEMLRRVQPSKFITLFAGELGTVERVRIINSIGDADDKRSKSEE
jgi:hypothetical protein